MLNRRLFLGGLAASVGAALAPRGLRAATGTPGRRFLFVQNPGGWDPLSALAPLYDAAGVQMSPASGPATSGGLSWVDTGSQAARAFFDTWHHRTALLHGVSVPSVSHEICTRLMLTGQVGAERPDWPTLVANAAADDFTLPSLVLGGSSFPGKLGGSSARTGSNGQLQRLLDGSIFDLTDQELPAPFRDPTSRLLDRYTLARTEARADAARGGAEAELTRDWHTANARVSALRGAAGELSFDAIPDLGGQLALAVETLARGLSRTASVASLDYGGWDTHTTNDQGQLPRFDLLFRELSRLMERLRDTPGPSGASLADDTTVVVFSEMGRTPLYNANAGRDHWPFTSVMLLGAGIAGDRVVGGYDDAYFGAPMALASGEVREDGVVPTVEHLGATLLALADLDPEDHVPGVPPIRGLLA